MGEQEHPKGRTSMNHITLGDIEISHGRLRLGFGLGKGSGMEYFKGRERKIGTEAPFASKLAIG